MSKFFKRIGTKATKFNFEAEILQVSLSLDGSCFTKVHWKRGKHSTMTSRSVQLNHRTGIATFKESLNLEATLFHSKKADEYQEKMSVFTVILESSKGDKQGGLVNFDLSDLPNSKQTRKVYEIKLEKSLDKNATLKFALSIESSGDVNDSQISESDRDGESSFRSQNLKGISQKDNGSNIDSASQRNFSARGIEDIPSSNHIRSSSQARRNSNAENEEAERIANAERLKRKRMQEEEEALEKEKQQERERWEQAKKAEEEELEQRRLAKEEADRIEFEKKQADLLERKEQLKRKQREFEEQQERQKEESRLAAIQKEADRKKELDAKYKREQEELELQRREKAEQIKRDRDFFLQQQQQQQQKPTSAIQKPSDPSIVKQSQQYQQQSQLRAPAPVAMIPKKPAGSTLMSATQKPVAPIQLDDDDEDEEENNIILMNEDEDDDDDDDDDDDNHEEVKVNKVSRLQEPIRPPAGRPQPPQEQKKPGMTFLNDRKLIGLDDDSKSPQKQQYPQKPSSSSNIAGINSSSSSGGGVASSNGQAAIMQLQQKNVEMNKKMNEVIAENEQLKKALAGSAGSGKPGDGKSSLLQIENERLKSKLADVNAANNKTQGELTQVNGNFKMLEMKYKNMQADFANLRKEYQDNREIIETLQEGKTSQDYQSKTSEIELKKRLDKINNQQEEITRLRNEQTNAESENFKLTKKIQELELTYKNAASQISQENGTVLTRVKQSLIEREEALREAKESQRKSEDELSRVSNELTRVEMRSKNIEMEFNKLNSKYEFSLVQAKNEVAQHDRELELKDKEIERLKSRVLEVLQQKAEVADADEYREQVVSLEKKNQYQAEYIGKLEAQIRAGESSAKEAELSKQKILELTEEIESQKQQFARNDKKARELLAAKDATIKEKRAAIADLEQKLLDVHKEELMKSTDDYDLAKYKELKRKNKQLVEEHARQVSSLQLQLEESKLSASRPTAALARSNLNLQSDGDNELAKLSIENEQLQRKVRDLMVKLQKSDQNADIMKAYKKLEQDYQTAKDELISTKMNKVSFDKKIEDNKLLMQQMESKIKELENDMNAMQRDLVKTKQKYGDALNVCLEVGGSELVDRIIQSSESY